jgi:hypothetical protein
VVGWDWNAGKLAVIRQNELVAVLALAATMDSNVNCHNERLKTLGRRAQPDLIG